MNRSQFKDPASQMCLAGAVVACWPLKQEVAGSIPFTVGTNNFVIEFAEFSKTFRENSYVGDLHCIRFYEKLLCLKTALGCLKCKLFKFKSKDCQL